jgi:MarR family transcriptional regulator for hemolysin
MIEGPGNAADLAERFESALYHSARDWRHAVDQYLKCRGLGLAGWMAIAAASQVHSPVSQTTLADMLSVSSASMVHMIDHLVKAGLVVREPSISDRRVKRILITAAGNRLYAELKNEAAAVRQHLLASVDSQNLACVTEFLEQLLRILQSYHGRAPIGPNCREAGDYV